MKILGKYLKLKYLLGTKGVVFPKTQHSKKPNTAIQYSNMALYNPFHGDYDNKTNGGQADFYHGEHDDEAYGQLYIPRIDAADANFDTVKNVFLKNKIGLVTRVEFKVVPVAPTYKGKHQKSLFSAYVYIKWFITKKVADFRDNIIKPGTKSKTGVSVDKETGTYWIVRTNTAQPSAELYEERCILADLKVTAEDVALRVLAEDADEEFSLYELTQTARAVALQTLYTNEAEENSLYELAQTARAVALHVLN